MKVYLYNDFADYVEGEEDVNPAIPREITDQDILYEYWNYWEGRMIDAVGDDSPLITHEHCIDDWIINNWAWEKK